MHIRRIDATRNDELATLLPAWQDINTNINLGRSVLDRLKFEVADGLDSVSLVLAAFDGADADSALGFVMIRLDNEANNDLGDGEICLRADQKDGTVAEALLAEAKAHLARSGRSRLHLNQPRPAPSPGYETLFSPTPAFTAICSGLDLAAVDRRQYAEWAAASPENQDYRIVHWVDHCPDELAESYSVCLNSLHDAPYEDLHTEHHQHDVARLRKNEALTVRQGLRRFVTVAVSEQGEVAGFTQSILFADDPEMLDLWSTAVTRAHRGHRLGLRIKAAATLTLLAELPSATWVITFNNHSNEHMLAVNGQLGYRPLGRWETHEVSC